MMLFIHKKNHFYGHIEKNFISKKPIISLSNISTLISDDEIAPYGCSGIANNKILAFKKGASESIDRRASMFFKIKKRSNNFVESYNLINNKIERLSVDNCHFRNDAPTIDTTGTAAHFIYQKAMENSVYELLQKNSLFLFWYGSTAKIYRINKSNKKKIFFVEDSFFPIITIICIDMIGNDYISIGLGTDIDFYKALKASEDECFMIKKLIEDTNRKLKFGGKLTEDEENQHQFFIDNNTKKYILNLEDSASDYEIILNKKTFNEAIKLLPSWLTDLRVYVIPQTIVPHVVCMKSFSKQLYTSVPKKENINLSQDINVKNISLTEEDLKSKPNLPII